jgi:hypothetical protein
MIRMKFSKPKIILLVCLFLLTSAGLSRAVELPRIDKNKIRLILAPGKAEYGEISVENSTSEQRNIRVYLSDWNYLSASDGTKEFLPVNTDPLSCAPWISFSPAEFTLGPFSKQKINYSVKAPQDASGGHYAALFFESVFSQAEDAKQEEMRVGINLAIRVATLFYVDADGTVKRTAAIDNLSFERNSSGEAAYKIGLDFVNNGNTDITTSATFHLMDGQGMVVARGAFNDTYTFPNASTKLSAVIKDALPEGKYTAVFTIDLGKALEEAGVGRGPVITCEAEVSIGRDGNVLSVGRLK